MKGPTCLRVGTLLGHRTVGISESERLLVEDHLAGCAGCREDARLLSGIVLLAQGPEGSVSATARDRILRRSIEAPSAPRAIGQRASAWPRVALGLALAGAAAVAIWVAVHPATPHAPTLAADRVEAGQLRAGNDTLSVGDAIPAERSLRATTASRARLAHAMVASDDAELTWHSADGRLALTSGKVHISVDPAPHRPFAVTTPAFAVEVVGTEFEVDLQGVRVISGIVRVTAPDGTLLAELGAGETWALRAEPTQTATAGGKPADPGAEPTPGPPPRATAGSSTPELLTRARQDLAARRPEAARKSLDAALAARPGRREEAEARTLLAECSQVQGDHAEAARLYRVVADRFADMSAGENALFAAARAEDRAGRPEEAVTLYRRYLDGHPQGRFAKEAKTRLQKSDLP